MLSFVLRVWLIANLLHPFMMMLNWGISAGDISLLIPFYFYVFLLSIPSLLIGVPVAFLINKMNTGNRVKYLLWLFLSPLIVAMNMCFIVFMIDGTHADLAETLTFAIPGMLAVLLASALCGPFFFKTMTASEKQPEESSPVQ